MASTKREPAVWESPTSDSEDWDTDLEDCCQQETRQRLNSERIYGICFFNIIVAF